jgi:hypothetical protein
VLYPIVVLEDCEARVAGLALSRALSSFSPERVTIDLGSASLRRALWSLPIIEAASAHFAGAELRLVSQHGVHRCFLNYERASQAHEAGGALRELRIELGAAAEPVPGQRAAAPAQLLGEGAQRRLIVPGCPFPAREQHAWEHAVDAAQAAGLPARRPLSLLRLAPDTRTAARAICRRLVGRFAGPLLALAPSSGGWALASFAVLRDRLADRIGAVSLTFGEEEVPGAQCVPTSDPELQAAILQLAAVCVGDDSDYAHLAAAVGTPTLIVHGSTSPSYSGPSSRHSVAAFTTSGHCAQCLAERGRRCLGCLDPLKVSLLAEKLAATRWPLDRLQRALP